MSKIKLLDKNVAELIAAGEVIERPASVVKELIENSIDAGAKSITVEIQNGGITFLRISDDGVGIPYDECPTAFLRHATSKVSTSEDLGAIATLGFRGEALASVAAVAKVSLLTKTADTTIGTSYKIEGGNEIKHSEAGCPDGTTIVIRELFYNLPARLKFLKKDVTEGNYIQSIIDKVALVNPQIAFRFVRDNKLVKVTPGDGKLSSAIYAIYGKVLAASMLYVDYSQNGISVSGCISAPLLVKSNRTFQNFYVNSRYIRSSTISAAVEQAYKNNIMTGKFPACVLNIKVHPGDVDANVHPAKTEVKFANERSVFNAVNLAVKNALLNSVAILGVNSENIEANKTNKSFGAVSAEPTEFSKNSEKLETSEILTFASPKTEYAVSAREIEPITPAVTNTDITIEYKYINHDSLIRKNLDSKQDVRNEEYADHLGHCRQKLINESVLISGQHHESQIVLNSKTNNTRIIGELFSTYIICERGDELLLIDKHAADERLQFERLKTELKMHSQLLLSPLEIKLDILICGILCENQEELYKLGIKIESSKISESILVLAMPTILEKQDAVQIEEMLTEIGETLQIGQGSEVSAINRILHSFACRLAVKAGDKTSSIDIEQLANRILEDETGTLRYCPHGRPIVEKITRKELEKRFKRIV
ncbi:MAG: DNA mismatch repair endonuclease MutL [Oscillospiraceae bacterium]|nr:DNA mismatch repair endonuclease MutL [Oscillospiraceae bacterium]